MLSYPIGQSGQLLCFTFDVLSHFRKHRQTRFFHREAGGQLFAILDGASIVVIEATGPRKSDYRTRRSYVPDRKAEKEEIAEQQRRGHFFVGDWHTHPEVIAKPSPTDLSSIRDCFRQSVHDLNGFVLVVVGTEELPRCLFVGITDGTETYELALQNKERPGVSLVNDNSI